MSAAGAIETCMPKKTGISVVIPTYNRKILLEKTLSSLCVQSLDKSNFEVIVIDDGSNDGTDVLVQSFESRMPIGYFFQEDLGFRVAKARNIGIDAAQFSIVLFIDSGVIASPSLLQKHLDLHQSTDKLAVIGLSYGVSEYDTRHAEEINNTVNAYPLEKALSELQSMPHLWDCRTRYLEDIKYQLNKTSIPWILFWTSHISVSSDLLKKIGGFDEWFHSWGGEDVELGLRLHQAGCRFEILPGVESIHYPHTRDGEKNRSESKSNVQYIHQKHQLESTHSLLEMNWEELVKIY